MKVFPTFRLQRETFWLPFLDQKVGSRCRILRRHNRETTDLESNLGDPTHLICLQLELVWCSFWCSLSWLRVWVGAFCVVLKVLNDGERRLGRMETSWKGTVRRLGKRRHPLLSLRFLQSLLNDHKNSNITNAKARFWVHQQEEKKRVLSMCGLIETENKRYKGKELMVEQSLLTFDGSYRKWEGSIWSRKRNLKRQRKKRLWTAESRECERG